MKCKVKATGCRGTYEKWTGNITMSGCCENKECKAAKIEANKLKSAKKVAVKPKTVFKKRGWYSKKLDTIAKTYAKQRDGYVCQKTGEKVEGSNAHGSHVVPVSAGNVLRWDITNIKCMSYHYHLNWWHKNPLESSEWFKDKFPLRWDYLKRMKAKKFKKTTHELAEFYKIALATKSSTEYDEAYRLWIDDGNLLP